jgi:uncharacterized protein YecE (DUF72 family)
MRFLVGTSGYSYKEWRGTFYPSDAKPQDMLRCYATRLGTVEINNTFYRMPSEKLLLDWAAQVPAGFSFVLKAPQRITHQERLAGSRESLTRLLQAATALGERLGPLLFQLPPSFPRDLPRLVEFLALLPPGARAAFEFRHPSWFETPVYEALSERGQALVVADVDGAEPSPIVPTAGFGYLRMRRAHYEEDALRRWIERVGREPWERAWVFFKHEDEGSGPALAVRFAELASGGS